jgi:DNA-directed RNA polymerase subunit M/transcription elongation factor TFIIS
MEEIKMGFIYCPNCGMSVSDQASISACPKCYHPFNAKEWQSVQAQKEDIAAEEKKKKAEKKAEEEQRLNFAGSKNECPLCHQPISWDRYNHSSGWNVSYYHKFRHPYCESCGWNSFLAFDDEQVDSKWSPTKIVDWEYTKSWAAKDWSQSFY